MFVSSYPKCTLSFVLTATLFRQFLRVGEIALLMTDSIDLNAGTLTFYRLKVDKTRTHKLTADTLRAATAYIGRV